MVCKHCQIHYVGYGICNLCICSSSLLKCRVGPGFSYGLNWALARKGVIVKDKAFQNLNYSELQKRGATIAGYIFTY